MFGLLRVWRVLGILLQSAGLNPAQPVLALQVMLASPMPCRPSPYKPKNLYPASMQGTSDEGSRMTHQQENNNKRRQQLDVRHQTTEDYPAADGSMLGSSSFAPALKLG